MVEVKDLVSLSELAKELNINKSKLLFYRQLGLITPVSTTTGYLMLFDKDKTVQRLKFIQEQKQIGLTLNEIKEELDKK